MRTSATLPRHDSASCAIIAAEGDTMNHISKRLEQALDAVRTLPPDQQDLLAVEMIERAHGLTQPPTKLSAEDRAELEAELAAARRGELATDDEVAAMLKKHGL